jgi:hypothetical protein
MTLLLRVFIVPSAALTVTACTANHGCSLNNTCRYNHCVCDPSWIRTNCRVLDLREAKPSSGYNMTGLGTSSWGSYISKIYAMTNCFIYLHQNAFTAAVLAIRYPIAVLTGHSRRPALKALTRSLQKLLALLLTIQQLFTA